MSDVNLAMHAPMGKKYHVFLRFVFGHELTLAVPVLRGSY